MNNIDRTFMMQSFATVLDCLNSRGTSNTALIRCIHTMMCGDDEGQAEAILLLENSVKKYDEAAGEMRKLLRAYGIHIDTTVDDKTIIN